MKYILMMTGTKASFDWYTKWPKQVFQAQAEFMRALNKELKDSGVLVETRALTWPEQAKLVRAGSNGEPITDGVFPETKEFLAGYWIVEVDSAEEAYRIAARASASPAPEGTTGTMPIEVRQIMSGPPEEFA
jgi:hypothetical protein